MALDDLLRAIDAEAGEELARLEADTRRQAAEILARGRSEASRVERELLAAALPAAEAEAERVRAEARLEAAARVRTAKEEYVREVLARLREHLTGLRSLDFYPAVLEALAGEARELLPGACVVRADRRDAALARDLCGRMGWDVQVDPSLSTWGGLEAESADGRLVRNTVEERLRCAEPELRRLIGAELGRAA